MEGKNKFNTYVVSFDYPSSYSSVFLRLRSLMYDTLMYDMNFSSIVADEYGIPRQLNENSFAITTSLAASEIEDLIRLKCLDLPDIDFDLSIMTVDDYFRQFYK
ncbi:TPA: type V toxin-antitoxin system endoribonuclease antitoxin GhoS [Escherichia coli]